MTNLNTLFPRNTFVGFDRLFEEFERMSRAETGNYPPYNIVKISDEHTQIQLAVAGFKKHEIDIALKDNVLTVSGEKYITQGNDEFIHKGISTRKFERSFRMHEYAEVVGATLEDGILSIFVEMRLPEEKKPRKIEIGHAPVIENKSEQVLLTEGEDQAAA